MFDVAALVPASGIADVLPIRPTLCSCSRISSWIFESRVLERTGISWLSCYLPFPSAGLLKLHEHQNFDLREGNEARVGRFRSKSRPKFGRENGRNIPVSYRQHSAQCFVDGTVCLAAWSLTAPHKDTGSDSGLNVRNDFPFRSSQFLSPDSSHTVNALTQEKISTAEGVPDLEALLESSTTHELVPPPNTV